MIRIYIFSLLVCTVSAMLACFGVHAEKVVHVDIGVSLQHGYSGSIAFGQNYYTSGGISYTSGSQAPIVVSSDQTSVFDLGSNRGDIGTGSGVGDYDQNIVAGLPGPDGTFTFQASFVASNNDWVQSNILTIIKDTSPPILPEISALYKILGAGQSGIIFDWSDSTDSGAGLQGYILTISTDSKFVNTYMYSVADSQVLVDASLLPSGQLYYTITARDHVGNSIITSPQSFVNDTISSGPPSGGGLTTSVNNPTSSTGLGDTSGSSTPGKPDNSSGDLSPADSDSGPTDPYDDDTTLHVIKFDDESGDSPDHSSAPTPDFDLIDISNLPVYNVSGLPRPGDNAQIVLGSSLFGPSPKSGSSDTSLTGYICDEGMCEEIIPDALIYCEDSHCFMRQDAIYYYVTTPYIDSISLVQILRQLRLRYQLMIIIMSYSLIYDIQIYDTWLRSFIKKI